MQFFLQFFSFFLHFLHFLSFLCRKCVIKHEKTTSHPCEVALYKTNHLKKTKDMKTFCKGTAFILYMQILHAFLCNFCKRKLRRVFLPNSLSPYIPSAVHLYERFRAHIFMRLQ